MNTHFESPWTPKGKFFSYIILCMGGWVTSNPAKFLPFHFMKLASLSSLVKDEQKISMYAAKSSSYFKIRFFLAGEGSQKMSC